MLKTDYDIPIFKDEDIADLNEYSNEMANALKTQINNTNNEIKEIDQKVIDAVNKFGNPLSYKGEVSTIQELPTNTTNGDIYNVTSENKNYIYNGTNWVEYSSTLDLTYLENNTKTTQTTEVSEELTINNCAGVKGKLDIKSGKTEQATREGYNKLPNNITTQNINGVDFIVNKDRTILVNGTATANALLQLNTGITYSAGKYRLSGCPKGGATDTYRFDLMNKANNNIPIIDIGNGAEFTLTEETTFIPRIRIQGGVTINNLLFKPMLVSDISKTIYEPYGVMPSPDYPSRIRNVGDNIQLFDKSTITSGYRLSTTGQPNVSAEINYTSDFIPVDGNTTYIRTNTVDAYTRWCFYDSSKAFISKDDENQIITTPSNARYIRFSEYLSRIDTMKLEKGSKLTSYSKYNCGSADFKVESGNIYNKDTDIELVGQFRGYANGEISTNANFNGIKEQVKPNTSYISNSTASQCSNLCFFDKNMKYISGDVYTGTNRVFTTPNNCEYITLAVHKGLIPTFELKEIKYKSFPFTEGQRLHIGDYLANNGTHHKRKTRVLDGTEEWVLSSNYTNNSRFSLVYSDIKINGKISSSHFVEGTGGTDTENIDTAGNGNRLMITVRNSIATTVEQWKAYLAEQYANGTPVTIGYELAEEIVIPYTTEQEEAYYELQHLLMYEGYTQITCIDEIKPDIQLTYWYNNELNTSYAKRIDSLEEKIRLLEKVVSSQTSEVIE